MSRKRPRPSALSHDEQQCTFHAALPEWDASVRAARDRTGYRPEWRPERDWDGSEPRPRYWEWLVANGRDLRRLAAAEVARLGLPALFPAKPSLGAYVRYWLACFFSDYDAERLEAVRAFSPAFDGNPSLVRVYPPAAQTLRVTLAEPEGSTPTLTIEGPAALVSRETLLDAAERALRMVEASRTRRHPVLDRGKRHASAIVRGRLDDRHELAFRLDAEGRTSREIADAVYTRWPERAVEASTVRRWLARARI